MSTLHMPHRESEKLPPRSPDFPASWATPIPCKITTPLHQAIITVVDPKVTSLDDLRSITSQKLNGSALTIPDEPTSWFLEWQDGEKDRVCLRSNEDWMATLRYFRDAQALAGVDKIVPIKLSVVVPSAPKPALAPILPQKLISKRSELVKKVTKLRDLASRKLMETKPWQWVAFTTLLFAILVGSVVTWKRFQSRRAPSSELISPIHPEDLVRFATGGQGRKAAIHISDHGQVATLQKDLSVPSYIRAEGLVRPHFARKLTLNICRSDHGRVCVGVLPLHLSTAISPYSSKLHRPDIPQTPGLWYCGHTGEIVSGDREVNVGNPTFGFGDRISMEIDRLSHPANTKITFFHNGRQLPNVHTLPSEDVYAAVRMQDVGDSVHLSGSSLYTFQGSRP